MATTTEANDEASRRSTTKIVDASLWWDPFPQLLAELESVSPYSDLPSPLVIKIIGKWFLVVLKFALENQCSAM